MDWFDLATLAFLAIALSLALLTGLWVLFSRPTGRRIVRFARRYRAAHPADAAGTVRDALRHRFLGGIDPQSGAFDAAFWPEFWLVEKFLMVLEGLRDFLFPIDRAATSARIDAAIQIVFPAAGDERRPSST